MCVCVLAAQSCPTFVSDSFATSWTIATRLLPQCRQILYHLSQVWVQSSSVQFSHLVVSDSLRPHEPQHARPPCPSPRTSLKLMSVNSVMPSSHLILCHPLLLLPPIPPSIRVFSNESTLRIRWPKYWSFSFNVSYME